MTAGIVMLGLAAGFGAGVFVVLAVFSWRTSHHSLGFWYAVLATAYIGITTIIGGRFMGYFLELPRWFSLMLLAPIFAVPPAIQLASWLKARRLVKERRIG